MNKTEVIGMVLGTTCFIVVFIGMSSCTTDDFRREDIQQCYSQQKERPVEEVLKLCGPLK